MASEHAARGTLLVPLSRSRTTITELMIPAYANFGGKIHGGTLLAMMDKARIQIEFKVKFPKAA